MVPRCTYTAECVHILGKLQLTTKILTLLTLSMFELPLWVGGRTPSDLPSYPYQARYSDYIVLTLYYLPFLPIIQHMMISIQDSY